MSVPLMSSWPAWLCVASLAPWCSAQSTWLNVSPLVNPPWSSEASMVYDAARQRVVLVTGNATWEWDGLVWVQKVTPVAPPARRSAAIACDRARGRVVLFGGSDPGGTQLRDTWEWDGSAWSLRATTGPQARDGAAMAFHPLTNRTLLFGGRVDSSPTRDTWEWDGAVWQQRTPVHTPQGRSSHALVFNPARGRILLLGGNPLVEENWEWDGLDWVQLANTTGRNALGSCVGYDSFRNSLILYDSPSTWELGASWARIYPRASPPSGSGGTVLVAGHEARGEVVLFSGSTWVLATDCRRVAPGHATGSLPAVCQTSPILGQSLGVAFPSAQNFGLIMLGPGPCESPFAGVGTPLFCDAGQVHAQPWVVLSAPGDPLTVWFQIPFDPGFVGLRACLQGMALQPGSCLRLTDALETRVRLR